MCRRVHLRMTEKRRLEMAAPAMKARITTRKRVRLFLSPTETASRDWADMVGGGVGIAWTSVVLRSSASCRTLPKERRLREGQLGAYAGSGSRHSSPPADWRQARPCGGAFYPNLSRSAAADSQAGKMLRFFPSCFSVIPRKLSQAHPSHSIATNPRRVNWQTPRFLASSPRVVLPPALLVEPPALNPTHINHNVWRCGS